MKFKKYKFNEIKNALKELSANNTSYGYLYILNVNGKFVKVGSTGNPYWRIIDLSKMYKNQGYECLEVAYSLQHKEYKKTENLVHRILKKYKLLEKSNYCCGREEYKLSFEKAIKEIENFEISEELLK